MQRYRTLNEIEKDYLCEHSEEIGDYLTIIFEEYARNEDTGAFLSSIRLDASKR